MSIVFFKRPQPKKFDYKPLYYDERQDELERRKKKKEITDEEEKKEAIRNEIRYRWSLHRKTARGKTPAMSILFYLVVVIILVMFVIYLMKKVGFDLIY